MNAVDANSKAATSARPSYRDAESLVATFFEQALALADFTNGLEAKVECKGLRFAVERQVRDDEQHLRLRVEDCSDATYSVVFALVRRPGRPVECRSGFSVDCFAYALPDDLDRLAVLVDALAQVLSATSPAIEAQAAPAKTLGAAWQQCQARLQKHWADVERERGLSVERLGIQELGRRVPCLALPTTRLGAGIFAGVSVSYRGEFEAISSSDADTFRAVAPTQKLLGEIKSLTGHQKLELLSGTQGEVYRSARKAFEQVRREGPKPEPAPLDAKIHVGLKFDYFNHRFFAWHADGCETKFYCKHVSLSLRVPQLTAPLVISLERNGNLILNRAAREDRFNSVEELDSCLRTAIEGLLACDPPWREESLKHFRTAFDPEHPVLAGLDVPPRHRPFLAAVLGAPYQTARSGAQKLAAKRAKSAKAVEAVSDLPDQIPDGAIFGNLKLQNVLRFETVKISQHSHLAAAHTASKPEERRRKRVLSTLLNGPESDRPFTPKHISRLIRYDNPDVFRTLPDTLLGWSNRDAAEAMFRISFDLEPGGPNPMMMGGRLAMDYLEFGPDQHNIRRTSYTGNGYEFLALAVSYRKELDDPDLRKACNDRLFKKYAVMRHVMSDSGAAFCMLSGPKGQTLWLRPSLRYGETGLDEADKDLLTDALTRLFEGSLRDAMLAKLQAAWTAMESELAAS